MKYFLFAILSILILLCIVYAIMRIYEAILKLQIKHASKKLAYLDYEMIKQSYETIMLCRRVHYEANFYSDLNEKVEIQKKCRKMYDESVIRLEKYEKEKEFLQYLTETEQNEIKEVLSAPRYELY